MAEMDTDQKSEIVGAIDSRASRRRKGVWEVCDQLSAQGLKPSLRSVKMHHSTGSDADIQKDVNAWFDNVFTLHHRRKTIPSVPDTLVGAVEKMWELAVAEAAARHEEERQRWSADHDQLQADLDAREAEAAGARSELDEMRKELANCESSLDAAQGRVHTLLDEAAELRRRADQGEVDLAKMRSAASAREEELRGELQRASSNYEKQLAEQRAGFESQVSAMREDMKERSDELRNAAGRADAHYRDLERNSLIEIDAQRQRAKMAEEALERMRAENSAQVIEVATARAELRTYRETTEVRLKEKDEEIRQLRQDLGSVREASAATRREEE